MEERFGGSHVASLGTYVTLQLKAAFQEMCRLMGVKDAGTRNYLSSMLDDCKTWSDLFEKATENPQIKKLILDHGDLINNIQLCLGTPKSQGIHACATVIVPKEDSQGNPTSIFDYVPMRKTSDGMLVTEWEGPQMEKAGFLKEDILGIKQLDKFNMIFSMIKDHSGEDLLPKWMNQNIPNDDMEVFKMFWEGNTSDVFQFSGQGMTRMLKELKPDSMDDLIAANALYRPGPMEYIPSYIKRKQGDESVEYDLDVTEKVLKSTFGICVFQEQLMQLSSDIAGFTKEESDNLRKAMGKKQRHVLDSMKSKFISGGLANGHDEKSLNKIWTDWEEFAKYAFNKCISGDTKLLRQFTAKTGKATYHPTVGEMYKIKNDINYAKVVGKMPLRSKYNRCGYGVCFSLNDEGKLVKNKIVDIYDSGVRDIYRVTTESGATIDCTLNHKFPTQKGELKLEDISIGDKLYVNAGYKQEVWKHSFINETKGGNGEDAVGSSKWWEVTDRDLNIEKGKMGFQSRDGEYSKLKKFRDDVYRKATSCNKCNEEGRRLEIHHIDGNHSNNKVSNLDILCSSCHKKEHYKMGRVSMGEKGLETKFEAIVSIEYLKTDQVYDVEMESPHHTFTVNTGIVTSNSHAAAYAKTAYWCQYLKVHYPTQFWTAALTFAKEDKVPVFINEILRQKSISIMPPDINSSDRNFTANIDKKKIFWSLSKISHLGHSAVESILNERNENGRFFDLEEFLDRVNVNKTVVNNLILSGSFDDMYDVNDKSERLEILNQFNKLRWKGNSKLVREDKEKFKEKFLCKESNHEWFWYLLQRKVSGMAHISSWHKIMRMDVTPNTYNLQQSLVDGIKFHESETVGKNVLVSGYIEDVEERKTKKGDLYSKVTLDCNYITIKVTIWGDTYMVDGNREKIKDSKGKIMFINGKVQPPDKWNDVNTIQSVGDNFRGSNPGKLTKVDIVG